MSGYEGSASNRPAEGALLAVGSAGAMADENGHVEVDNIPAALRYNTWLRYLVSVNGTDIVKEIQLTREQVAPETEPEPEPETNKISGPTMLWDFNEDQAMSLLMGRYKNSGGNYLGSTNNVSYTGRKDADGNNYYAFTSTNKTPNASFDYLETSSGKNLHWVRYRARNLSRSKKMSLAIVYGIGWQIKDLPLEQDTEWHEYVAQLPVDSKWNSIDNLFLFPFSTAGQPNAQDEVDIDYMAFFLNEESARAYEGPTGAAEPKAVLDFNTDNFQDGRLGNYSKNQVSWTSGKDGLDNEFYTFTASGPDPYVSIEIPGIDLNNLKWLKVRAKNVSGAKAMELYAPVETDVFKEYRCSRTMYITSQTCTHVDLIQDSEWHTYLINIPQENVRTANAYKGANLTQSTWSGPASWLRLDPMWNSGDGDVKIDDQIQIDYMAFFSDEEAAKAYEPAAREGEEPVEKESEEESASMDDLAIDGSLTVDISSNFPNGVSPVTSSIFQDIQITGEMSNPAWQVGLTSIPAVYGETAHLTVKVKPQSYTYSYMGENGKVISGTKQEVPKAIQFVVYDQNDNLRGVYEPVTDREFNDDDSTWEFQTDIEFVEPPDPDEITDDEQEVGFMPMKGDKLYLRLTTNRMAVTSQLKTKDGKTINDYQYSDVFTGKTFTQPASDRMPPVLGVKDSISFKFDDLPLVGAAGMNIVFPFVNVGISRVKNGYRMYIGFSPVQIAGAITGKHPAVYSGSDGQYWKDLFSMAHPFDTFAGGFQQASQAIDDIHDAASEAKRNNEKYNTGSLGSPSWRFDMAVGFYFDFIKTTITQKDASGGVMSESTEYIFSGMGGFVSVTLGFKYEWYFILPVVFLPAYIGIEMEATVMGFLGADLNKDVVITYDDSLNNSVDINDGIDSLTGQVLGSGYVQLCFGVGLCGTLGVRIAGKVNVIGDWQPDNPHGAYGLYVGISAGVIIDLFLFSVPLMYSFPGIPYGSFDYYAHPEQWTTETAGTRASLQSDRATLQLRESPEEDSVWRGSDASLMGAFAPSKTQEKVLVDNAYERPDAQLITLQDGETMVLAFLDSDSSKGAAQRTTLKMATYANGHWSEAVTVSGDNTADFQPSIAETKDGKILVAWVSTSDDSITDLSADDQVMAYLNSMEVYAAFVELDGSKQIKTKNDRGVTVADTEITRISNDHYTRSNGAVSSYYDSNPTVVCDMESGDAMIYYIKSGRSSLGDGDITDYINPYTNDCVVCYMPFNAETDADNGKTIPAGWLFDSFYYNETHGDTANEQMLINNFGGQRFLDGPVNDKNERYTIPDFTAISYNGLGVYAYTVDTDGRFEAGGVAGIVPAVRVSSRCIDGKRPYDGQVSPAGVVLLEGADSLTLTPTGDRRLAGYTVDGVFVKASGAYTFPIDSGNPPISITADYTVGATMIIFK